MSKYGIVFDQALELILKNEGFYSNDPDDAGAETFRGISRKFHPNWKGWGIVDKFQKTAKVLEKEYHLNSTLQNYVAKFYYFEFYKKCHSDFFEKNHPTLAYNIFDFAINSGIKSSLKTLQQSLNNIIYEKNIKIKPLMVDGLIGPHSITTFNKLSTIEDFDDLIIRSYQKNRVMYYINITKHNPSYLKFLKGWTIRALNINTIKNEKKIKD